MPMNEEKKKYEAKLASIFGGECNAFQHLRFFAVKAPYNVEKVTEICGHLGFKIHNINEFRIIVDVGERG